MPVLTYLNKKVYQLDNRVWLKSQRQIMSRDSLAKELGCFAGSIEWAERCFSAEEKATFVYKRKHNKNLQS